eukprot:g4763.t1
MPLPELRRAIEESTTEFFNCVLPLNLKQKRNLLECSVAYNFALQQEMRHELNLSEDGQAALIVQTDKTQGKAKVFGIRPGAPARIGANPMLGVIGNKSAADKTADDRGSDVDGEEQDFFSGAEADKDADGEDDHAEDNANRKKQRRDDARHDVNVSVKTACAVIGELKDLIFHLATNRNCNTKVLHLFFLADKGEMLALFYVVVWLKDLLRLLRGVGYRRFRVMTHITNCKQHAQATGLEEAVKMLVQYLPGTYSGNAFEKRLRLYVQGVKARLWTGLQRSRRWVVRPFSTDDIREREKFEEDAFWSQLYHSFYRTQWSKLSAHKFRFVRLDADGLMLPASTSKALVEFDRTSASSAGPAAEAEPPAGETKQQRKERETPVEEKIRKGLDRLFASTSWNTVSYTRWLNVVAALISLCGQGAAGVTVMDGGVVYSINDDQDAKMCFSSREQQKLHQVATCAYVVAVPSSRSQGATLTVEGRTATTEDEAALRKLRWESFQLGHVSSSRRLMFLPRDVLYGGGGTLDRAEAETIRDGTARAQLNLKGGMKGRVVDSRTVWERYVDEYSGLETDAEKQSSLDDFAAANTSPYAKFVFPREFSDTVAGELLDFAYVHPSSSVLGQFIGILRDNRLKANRPLKLRLVGERTTSGNPTDFGKKDPQFAILNAALRTAAEYQVGKLDEDGNVQASSSKKAAGAAAAAAQEDKKTATASSSSASGSSATKDLRLHYERLLRTALTKSEAMAKNKKWIEVAKQYAKLEPFRDPQRMLVVELDFGFPEQADSEVESWVIPWDLNKPDRSSLTRAHCMQRRSGQFVRLGGVDDDPHYVDLSEDKIISSADVVWSSSSSSAIKTSSASGPTSSRNAASSSTSKDGQAAEQSPRSETSGGARVLPKAGRGAASVSVGEQLADGTSSLTSRVVAVRLVDSEWKDVEDAHFAPIRLIKSCRFFLAKIALVYPVAYTEATEEKAHCCWDNFDGITPSLVQQLSDDEKQMSRFYPRLPTLPGRPRTLLHELETPRIINDPYLLLEKVKEVAPLGGSLRLPKIESENAPPPDSAEGLAAAREEAAIALEKLQQKQVKESGKIFERDRPSGRDRDVLNQVHFLRGAIHGSTDIAPDTAENLKQQENAIIAEEEVEQTGGDLGITCFDDNMNLEEVAVLAGSSPEEIAAAAAFDASELDPPERDDPDASAQGLAAGLPDNQAGSPRAQNTGSNRGEDFGINDHAEISNFCAEAAQRELDATVQDELQKRLQRWQRELDKDASAPAAGQSSSVAEPAPAPSTDGALGLSAADLVRLYLMLWSVRARFLLKHFCDRRDRPPENNEWQLLQSLYNKHMYAGRRALQAESKTEGERKVLKRMSEELPRGLGLFLTWTPRYTLTDPKTAAMLAKQHMQNAELDGPSGKGANASQQRVHSAAGVQAQAQAARGKAAARPKARIAAKGKAQPRATKKK